MPPVTRRGRWVDGAVLGALVEHDGGRLGAGISKFTVLADRGRIWPVAAGCLLLLPSRRTRRAAVAAGCAVAVEAGLCHSLKPLARRNRPPWWQRLGARNAGRSPSTWSMPSAHAGDAAAFAAAAGTQAWPLGAVLGAFAALVSASRILTARHYPSDVMVGLTSGVAVGLVTGRRARVGQRALKLLRRGAAPAAQ